MKRFLIIFALLISCSSVQAENEYLTQDMLETTQEGEIALIEDDDTLIDGLNMFGEHMELTSPKDEELETPDDIEDELKLFNTMGKTKYTKEETIVGKILKSKIIRTDIPSFLLKDELTFDFNKGPIKEIELYGGHRGSLASIFKPHNYTTEYSDLTTEFGFMGKSRNDKIDFRLSILPIVKHGNYLENMWGDIYIVDNHIKHHKILIGRSRGQVGIEGGGSAYTLPFVNRSQIARNFGNLRTTAVKLIGNFEYADYSLSLGSSGRYLTSGMPGLDFIGWVNIKPFGSKDGKLGRLTIGGGLNSGHNRFNYNVGTVYIGYKHKKLWTNFEASIADGYNGGAALSSKKAGGFAYTLGWKVKPYLQLIGRIDNFDPDRSVSHNCKTEYTAGINWFIKGQALRFVINYVFSKNQNAHDSHKIILGTQILL